MTDTRHRSTASVQPHQPRRDVPPGLWAHVAEWTALAVALLFTLAAADLARRGPLWLPPAAALVAGLAGTYTAGLTQRPGFMVWSFTCTLLAAAWESWAAATGPWHLVQAVALMAAGTLMVPVGVGLLAIDANDRGPRQDEPDTPAPGLADWAAVFDDLAMPGVIALEDSEHDAGRDVLLKLPRKGRVNFATIAAAKPDVERALGLRPDAVRFEADPADSSLVWMHVTETDTLAVDVPFPLPDRLLSVNDPLPVGVDERGQRRDVLFREVQVMVVGMTGAGKSNLLNVLIALWALSRDTVIWVIDFKGGRLAAPWITPWVRGESDAPVVDWVATNREEAMAMLRAAEVWMDTRTRSLAGGSKIIPSPATPKLMVIVDEANDLTSYPGPADLPKGLRNADFVEVGTTLGRKGRSEAVQVTWVGQRAVGTAISADIKSQCALRFTLGLASESEGRTVSDDYWNAKIAAMLNEPGSGLVTLPGERHSMPVKFYRLDPGHGEHGGHDLAVIHQVAMAAGNMRASDAGPVIEPAAVAAMGRVYAGRWEGNDLYRRVAAANGITLEAEPRRAAELPEDVDAVLAAMAADLAGVAAAVEADVPAARVHPARARLYALLAQRRQLGIALAEVKDVLRREGIRYDPSSLHRWLNEDIAAGKVVKMRQDGWYRLAR